jgi:hypothetical protein
MSQKHIVQLIDDIDGSPATETIAFSLDGSAYEIDLNSVNAAKLREAFALFIGSGRRVARPVSGAKRAKSSNSEKGQVAAIREWAKQNGFKIGEKGRIPSTVLEAYDAQH